MSYLLKEFSLVICGDKKLKVNIMFLGFLKFFQFF